MSDTIPASTTLAQWYKRFRDHEEHQPETPGLESGLYKLGAVGDSDPFANTRVELAPWRFHRAGPAEDVYILDVHRATWVFTTDWQMVHENLAWFGDTLSKQVPVDRSPDGLVLNDPMESDKNKAVRSIRRNPIADRLASKRRENDWTCGISPGLSPKARLSFMLPHRR